MPSESLSDRFAEYFEKLKPDDDGVLRVRQPFEKFLLLFEVYEKTKGQLRFNVFLDIFTADADHEQGGENSILPLVEYDETLEDPYGFHSSETMPDYFLNEARLIVPALLQEAQNRHEYVQQLRRETEHV